MSSTDLILPSTVSIDVAEKLQFLVDSAAHNLDNSLASNTKRAYRSQWLRFETWCRNMGITPFPASEKALLLYLTHRVEAGASLSTVTQAYSAIREQHRIRDVPPPALDGQLYRSWTGARKKASRSRVISKARALLPETLKAAVRAAQGELATRDRALLLIGWCGAMRSDEIISLNLENITVEQEGLRVQIVRSKTDQFGAGHEVGVARASSPEFCPVEAWKALGEWMGWESEDQGPAFVSGRGKRLSQRDVTRILIRNLKRAGIESEGYSSHSLRAGCITAAAQAGHSLEAIQRQSRHRSLEVLLGYIRTATLLTDNVTKGLL